jgi:hypothetical protein
MIEIPDAHAVLHESWTAVINLAKRHPEGWTVIGAQMVALHAYEHGRTPPRSSLDIDLVVNVRLIANGTRIIAESLQADGFELEGMNHFEVGHRFCRGPVTFDVLAPDNPGERASLITIPPAHTVTVPGGTQALNRTTKVEIAVGETVGIVPRPDLLGAILVKARAVDVDDVPAAQRVDLAFLLTLVENPRSMRDNLRRSERRWLRDRPELLDPQHAAWRRVDDPDVGLRALRVLSADG